MSTNFLSLFVFLITSSFSFSFSFSLPLKLNPKQMAGISVIGSVFCDSCADNAFSNRSYFLQGAKVQIQCRFRAVSPSSRTDVSITANATTDQYGVYKHDIPPLPGFRCSQAQKLKSFCQATLISSSSTSCNLPFLQRSSTTHVAVRANKTNLCIFNLNALSFRPLKIDAEYCGACSRVASSSLDSELFFWPLFPPFGFPWLHWPPLPFIFPPLPFPFNSIPLPDPLSLPLLLPPWLKFLDPSNLPFPFSLLFPPRTLAPSFSPSPTLPFKQP